MVASRKIVADMGRKVVGGDSVGEKMGGWERRHASGGSGVSG